MTDNVQWLELNSIHDIDYAHPAGGTGRLNLLELSVNLCSKGHVKYLFM